MPYAPNVCKNPADITQRGGPQKPFAVPFPDEDIPAIVEYLVKTYGNE
jgi:hypothetical protein